MLKNIYILIFNAIYLLFANLIDQSLQLTECQFADNSSNPCVNGICLNNTHNIHHNFGNQCYCFNGFTGTNCTKKINQCLPQNPCQHNATCENLDNIQGVKCTCTPGYCGKYCEFEVNECLSNPCVNGGTCVDQLNAYLCKCPSGYTGKQCETDVNICINKNSTKISDPPCLNGGTCVDGPGDRYFCACNRGFSGHQCESRIKECDSNPCLNGGRCEETESDYQCICSLGWTGSRCKIPLIECKQRLCKNSGICMKTNKSEISDETNANLQTDQIFCYCLPDFYGKYCQYKYDDCLPHLCLNDGVCIDDIDGYICNCSQGFSGTNCQINCLDPMNEQLCVVPTSAFTDIKTTFIPIMSSVKPSSQSNDTSIYTTFIELNSSDIERTKTPILSTSDIFDITATYGVNLTPLPVITTSPTISIPEPTPIIEPNITIPSSALNQMRIYIPRFNGFNSSLIYRTKRSKRDLISILLSFKPDSIDADGLQPLFYSKSTDNHELLLYIQNNTLLLLLSKNVKKILFFETNFTIISNTFNKIETKLWITSNNANLYFMLTLNETNTGGHQEVVGLDLTELCLFDVFYLGELPAHHNMALIRNGTHFNGCIRDVKINEFDMFFTDAIKLNDISECDPNVENICSQSPCRNGGICTTDDQSWQCICPIGYKNEFCEKAYCSEQVCHNEGICILPDFRTYLCVCPHGWNGNNCQLKTKQAIASFDSEFKRSFIKYNLQNQTNHLEIKFRFATLNPNQSNALLLFMSNQQQNQSFIIDFISISLESGILFFRINLGHGMKSLWTPIDTNLTEQLVFFGHHNQFVWLIVVPEDVRNIKPIVGETPHSFKALNVSPHLYVGGHDSYTGHPFLHSLTGFKGCIYDIEIRTALNVNFEQISDHLINKSFNVGVCNIIDDCDRH